MTSLRCTLCGSPLSTSASDNLCAACRRARQLESTVGVATTISSVPESGTVLGGYHLLRELGRGGMGAVFEAEQLSSGRRVALKVLQHRLDTPEHRQRFLREGRLAAALVHPNCIYVFGTEEIDGIPTISMELAAAGTLQDRVRNSGPLPFHEAVDAALAMLDGLEAAATRGILHRDVKPSNAFIAADGTIKIGDFGLSISTTGESEWNVTQTGTFLGTPAYSAPEQLRGEPLDFRADMYALGGSLYYLLTGETPFPAKPFAPFVATVLEQPAPSPRRSCPGLPRGLAAIVTRCLAKQPSERFPSYQELRQALQAYQSDAATPATLGYRMVAYALDTLVLAGIAVLVPLTWTVDIATWQNYVTGIADPTDLSQGIAGPVVGAAIQVLYFGLLDGVWGKTIGKAVCRLEVHQVGRGVPGIPRGILRAAFFLLPGWLAWWCVSLSSHVPDGTLADRLGLFFTILGSVMWVILFVSARRRNGFAGMHELASGTRVLRSQERGSRRSIAVPEEHAPEFDSTRKVGPYLFSSDARMEAGQVVVGWDSALMRKVWIRFHEPETPPYDARLQSCTRMGRLRWLNGRRSDRENWDAFEAPRGLPLGTHVRTPRPWSEVRFWLCDLAEEVRAREAGGETWCEQLQISHIWITQDGRAKLLDFAPPNLEPELELAQAEHATCEPNSDPVRQMGEFLRDVAAIACASPLDPHTTRPARATPLPVTARDRVLNLWRSTDLAELARTTKDLTNGPADVPYLKRTAALLACVLFPLILTVSLLAELYLEQDMLRRYPGLGELVGITRWHQRVREAETTSGALLTDASSLSRPMEVTIVGRYGELLADPRMWQAEGGAFFDTATRDWLQSLPSRYPELSAAELRDATIQLEPSLAIIRSLQVAPDDYVLYSPTMDAALIFTVLLLMTIYVPGCISVIVWRESLLLRWLEIAVVTRDGKPASRLRHLARNTLLWSVFALVTLAAAALWTHGHPVLGVSAMAGYLGLQLAQKHAWYDRLAGTCLVPR
jgi:eukaryotic-like serine/threonine-protein kinase